MAIEENNDVADSQSKTKRKTSLKPTNKKNIDQLNSESTTKQADTIKSSTIFNSKRNLKNNKENITLQNEDPSKNTIVDNKRKPTLQSLNPLAAKNDEKLLTNKDKLPNKKSNSAKKTRETENSEEKKSDSIDSKINNSNKTESGSQLLLNLFSAIQRDVSSIKEILQESMQSKTSDSKNPKFFKKIDNESLAKTNETIDSSSDSKSENDNDLEAVYYDLIKRKYKIDVPFSAVNSRKLLLRPEDKLTIAEWNDMLEKISKKGLMECCDETEGKKRFKILK